MIECPLCPWRISLAEDDWHLAKAEHEQAHAAEHMCDWPGCARQADRDRRCRYHAGRNRPSQAAHQGEDTPTTEGQ